MRKGQDAHYSDGDRRGLGQYGTGLGGTSPRHRDAQCVDGCVAPAYRVAVGRHELRRSGDVAFANVYVQRPGGGEIDINNTRGAAMGVLDADYMDGTSLQALHRKSGKTWVAVHWVIGATDVWWAQPALCLGYAPVIEEACYN